MSRYDDSDRRRPGRDPYSYDPRSSRYQNDDDDDYDRPQAPSSRRHRDDFTSRPQPRTADTSDALHPILKTSGDDPRSSRRTPASDDERDTRRKKRVETVAEPGSRHDAEARTSASDRRFREKRGGYTSDEGAALKRSKSHSPNPSARGARSPKDEGSSSRGDGRGEARTGRDDEPLRRNRYDQEDLLKPRAAAVDSRHGGSHVSRTSSRDNRDSQRDRPSKLASREERSRGSRNDDDDDAYMRRHKPRGDERGSERNEPKTDGRQRLASGDVYRDARGGRLAAADDDAPGPSASSRIASDRRKRQSLPPQSRFREDDHEDSDRDRNRDRDRHHTRDRDRDDDRNRDRVYDRGHDRDRDRRGQEATEPRRRRSFDHEDRPRASERSSRRGDEVTAGPRGSQGRKGGKQWQQEAGTLFKTHALPVIKTQALPLLTKAARAYLEQKR